MQTFIGNSMLCAILLITQTHHLKPALAHWAFFKLLLSFETPTHPSPILLSTQSSSSYLIWSHSLSLIFSPLPSFCPHTLSIAETTSRCNCGNISLWQCVISRAAYLLTDWINLLYLVWETVKGIHRFTGLLTNLPPVMTAGFCGMIRQLTFPLPPTNRSDTFTFIFF